ncbi:unnamed protein product [Spirodela intermedia]|uniref:DUF7054 domain-containing protein n=1 Tax=Spirodela intermedia TaxID=51605 RepID=A0A7I8JBK5_SPIIN|nr:unnamed protein product [Spirodela intermedia]CAA6666853.1 unnamed protein product [Spirodela intermedia]
MDRMTTIRRPGSLPQGIGCGMKPTKLLLRVTVQRNLWPVHVMISPESTVVDLIKATVEAYVKEGRRPLLVERDPLAFELHFSQFSLESLSREEKVINLGSRNFFLCLKPSEAAPSGDCRRTKPRTNPPSFFCPSPDS